MSKLLTHGYFCSPIYAACLGLVAAACAAGLPWGPEQGDASPDVDEALDGGLTEAGAGGGGQGGASVTQDALPEPAGCLPSLTAVRHQTSRKVLPPSTEAVYGCLADTGGIGPTPMLGVTHNGTLFVARASTGVLRSKDGGQTWAVVDVPDHENGDSHRGGIHGFVHVDSVTDRVYYITSLGAASCGGSSGAVISWTDDLGVTWHGSTVGCDTYDWGKLVSAPAVFGHGRVLYFLGVGERLIGNKRFVYRSRDGGETWARTATIASATVEPGIGVAGPEGTIYFDQPESLLLGGIERQADTTYPWNPANECKLIIVVSEDEGDTWRHEPVPN